MVQSKGFFHVPVLAVTGAGSKIVPPGALLVETVPASWPPVPVLVALCADGKNVPLGALLVDSVPASWPANHFF